MPKSQTLKLKSEFCDLNRFKIDRYAKKSQNSTTTNRFPIFPRFLDGTAVDPDSGLQDIAHVYCEGSLKYFAILNLVDIAKDKNSYYKIQLLEADNKKRKWVPCLILMLWSMQLLMHSNPPYKHNKTPKNSLQFLPPHQILGIPFLGSHLHQHRRHQSGKLQRPGIGPFRVRSSIRR